MSNINDKATVNLFVNGEQAEQAMQRLSKRAGELKAAITAAMEAGNDKEAKKLQSELDRVNKEFIKTKSTAQGAGVVLNNLSNFSIHGLRNALKYLQRELKLSKPNSEAWYRYAEAIDRVKARLAQLNEELEGQQSLWGKFKQWADNSWPAIDLLSRGYNSVVNGLRKYVDEFADMDQEMANVRKFTGMTQEQVADLNEMFKKIDTRTSREDLNKLAQEAGRLGKSSKEDVLGFVRSADKINVALDDLGDGATLTLSKLTGVFGDEARYGTEQSLIKVGSVINELSQNCRASAPYLANFSERMGGVGEQAGLTIQQIMGFGAVLDSNSQKVEASSTALSQVIVRLMQDPAKYAKVAGIDVKKFTEMLKTDVNGALILFLETLHKAGGMNVLSPMFKDMGENGSRAIMALSTLAANIDKVKQQQDAANIAFAEGTSIDKEFAVQNGTKLAALEKSRKRFQELRVELGEKLSPLMTHILSSTSAMARAVNILIDFIFKHKTEIAALTIATAAYITALKLHAMWLDRVAVKTALLDKSSKLLAVSQKALTAVMAVARLGATALANSYQYLRNGLQVTYEMQERWRKSMSAMKFSTWAGLILAVGAAVYLLYKRWSEASAVAKAHAKIQEDANAAIADTVTKINSLKSVIEDNNRSLMERYNAIKELKGIMAEYNGTLDQEGRLLNHNTQLIDDYIRKLRERAIAAATEDAMKDAYKQVVDLGLELSRNVDSDSKTNGLDTFKNKLLSGEITNDLKFTHQPRFLTGYGATTKYYQPGFVSDIGNGFSVSGSSQLFGLWKTGQQETVEKFNDAVDVFISLSGKVDDNFKKSLTPQQTHPQINSGFANENKTYKAEADKITADYNHQAGLLAKEGNAQKQQRLIERRDFLIQTLNDKYEKEIAAYNSKSSAGSGYTSQTIADKEAKKNELEAKRELAKANAAYKAEMEKAKGDFESASADNIVAYATGNRSYEDYITEKERLDKKYVNDRIEIYNGLYQDETKENKALLLKYDEDYQALLLKKAEYDKSFADAASKRNIATLKKEYEEQLAFKKAGFDSPGSSFYQDDSAQQEALFQLKIDYLIKYRDSYKINSKEWLEYEAQIQAAEQNRMLEKRKLMNELIAKWRGSKDAAVLDATYRTEMELLNQAYEKKKISEEEYQKWKAQLEERYNRKKSKKSYEVEITNADGDPETVDTRTPSERKTAAYTAATDKRDQTIAALTELYDAGAISEEEYQKRCANARRQANKSILDAANEGLDAQTRMLFELGEAWYSFFDSLIENGGFSFDNLEEMAQATTAALCAGLEMYSQFAQAQARIDVANTEKKYDAMIEAAQGNSYKTKKLEKEKEQKVAKIKADASKKEFNIKVIEALAQTAQNALMAYGSLVGIPFVGPALAAAAAATATALGMVQVALIKKQQKAAQAEGYSKGGFTKPGAVDEPAGIVHAGEWVASQRLLANPVARPMIDALDYAQRNNAIGSLRAEDVSRSIRASDSLAMIAEGDNNAALMVAAIAHNAKVIGDLTDRLSEPFVTVNTVTGDHGIKQAQSEYDSLIRNVTPKSKRK